MRSNIRTDVIEPVCRTSRARLDLLRRAVPGAILLALVGCRNDMYDQPRYEPLEPSGFFADGTSARPLVEGTIPRPGGRNTPEAADSLLLNTGLRDGQLAVEPPIPVDRRVFERGQERYRIFCVPCHGELGDGRGLIVLRGFTAPPPLFSEELRNEPIGYFFEVMTHGHGVMYSYASRVPPRDRWAIAAYIRALQSSQHSVAGELPAADRRALEETTHEPAIR